MNNVDRALDPDCSIEIDAVTAYDALIPRIRNWGTLKHRCEEECNRAKAAEGDPDPYEDAESAVGEDVQEREENGDFDVGVDSDVDAFGGVH